jgi:beta-1,4-N-acetylglucosaminyltransferase
MEVIIGVVAAILLGLIFINLMFGKRTWKTKPPFKTLIILGSGGHTAEMFSFLKTLDMDDYTPRCYIVANTDLGVNGSENKAKQFENSCKKGSFRVCRIPRSREVGQSWLIVPWFVLKALIASSLIMFREWPDLV